MHTVVTVTVTYKRIADMDSDSKFHITTLVGLFRTKCIFSQQPAMVQIFI